MTDKPESAFDICDCGCPRGSHREGRFWCQNRDLGGCGMTCMKFRFNEALTKNEAKRIKEEIENRAGFDQIDLVGPFMDEGWSGEGWAPSSRLKIGYCVLLTQPGKDRAHCASSAFRFLEAMVSGARRLWREGYYPNPWADPPIPRASNGTSDGPR